jgi:hypothetical protein
VWRLRRVRGLSVLDALGEEQRRLWERLARFDVDDHERPALPFAARLARENGWSSFHARRVVAEYRRFLFLAVVAGHPVTPSETVDLAWHLHLVYTRSYWDVLCREVLRRPLHHGPTRGGAAEGARFDEQYRATLTSYARIFGAPPPTDIWPDPSVRFGAELRWRRVWTSRAWIVPKRRAWLALAALLAALGVALTRTSIAPSSTVEIGGAP